MLTRGKFVAGSPLSLTFFFASVFFSLFGRLPNEQFSNFPIHDIISAVIIFVHQCYIIFDTRLSIHSAFGFLWFFVSVEWHQAKWAHNCRFASCAVCNSNNRLLRAFFINQLIFLLEWSRIALSMRIIWPMFVVSENAIDFVYSLPFGFKCRSRRFFARSLSFHFVCIFCVEICLIFGVQMVFWKAFGCWDVFYSCSRMSCFSLMQIKHIHPHRNCHHFNFKCFTQIDWSFWCAINNTQSMLFLISWESSWATQWQKNEEKKKRHESGRKR